MFFKGQNKAKIRLGMRRILHYYEVKIEKISGEAALCYEEPFFVTFNLPKKRGVRIIFGLFLYEIQLQFRW